MTPAPTGRLEATEAGRDLVIERAFRASIDDVWASITESDRTARWFASWTGVAGPGKTIHYRLEFEEGKPEADMRIDACDPPHRLAVHSIDEFGAWRLEALLEHTDGITTLRFVHHLDEGVDIGSVGPGWEYYLDMLVASRDDKPSPSFDDYYPAQQDYYRGLTPA